MINKTLSKFEYISCIGEGTIGATFVGRHTVQGRHYYLKSIPKDFLQTKDLVKFFTKALNLSEHENVLSYGSADSVEGYTVLRQQELNDLDQPIALSLAEYHRRKSKPWSPDEVRCVIAACLEGLIHLHAHEVRHLNIKPNNIIIEQGICRLSDFGLYSQNKRLWQTYFDKHLDKSRATIFSFQPEVPKKIATCSAATIESYIYMSPEVKQLDSVSDQSDIFSIGILAKNLFLNQLLTLNGSMHINFLSIDDDWKKWIRTATDTNPEKRFSSAREMLENLPSARAEVSNILSPL